MKNRLCRGYIILQIISFARKVVWSRTSLLYQVSHQTKKSMNAWQNIINMQCAVLLFKFKLFFRGIYKVERCCSQTIKSCNSHLHVFSRTNIQSSEFQIFAIWKQIAISVFELWLWFLHELILMRIAFYQWNDRSIYWNRFNFMIAYT